MTKIISEPVSQEELNESLAIQQIMSKHLQKPLIYQKQIYVIKVMYQNRF